MHVLTRESLIGLSTASLLAATGTSFGLFSDSFETDTSADYSLLNTGTDFSADFAFDYLSYVPAAGAPYPAIPLAPRSAPGDSKALRLQANLVSPNSNDFLTAVHNTPVTGRYAMEVDVFMSYPVTAGAGGTTEYAHIGVGSDGLTANSVFTPIDGSGSFMAVTGEGGSTTSDYRFFIEGPTTLPTSNPMHQVANDGTYTAGQNTNATLQSYFPDDPANPYDVAGVPFGFEWATVTVKVGPGRVQYYIDGNLLGDSLFAENYDPVLGDPDGTPIAQASDLYDGLIALGLGEPFGSVATPPDEAFILFDNLDVYAVPEPASVALLGLGGLAALRRRR